MAIWEKQNEYHFLSLGCNCKNESNFYLLNVTSCDFLFNCDCSCVVNGLQMQPTVLCFWGSWPGHCWSPGIVLLWFSFSSLFTFAVALPAAVWWGASRHLQYVKNARQEWLCTAWVWAVSCLLCGLTACAFLCVCSCHSWCRSETFYTWLRWVLSTLVPAAGIPGGVPLFSSQTIGE